MYVKFVCVCFLSCNRGMVETARADAAIFCNHGMVETARAVSAIPCESCCSYSALCTGKALISPSCSSLEVLFEQAGCCFAASCSKRHSCCSQASPTAYRGGVPCRPDRALPAATPTRRALSDAGASNTAHPYPNAPGHQRGCRRCAPCHTSR